jgi:hypothetical protein
MNYDDLRDYQHQLVPDFDPSSATGPITKFLADMPGLVDSFQDGLMKEVDLVEGLSMPETGLAPPCLPLREAIEVLNALSAHHSCMFISEYTI